MLILLSDAITHNEKIIHHKYASVADVVGYHREARTNKTLIALFLKYEESPDWNGFYLEHIPDKYINFYSLEGFDNFTPSDESIKIHLTEYKLDKIATACKLQAPHEQILAICEEPLYTGTPDDIAKDLAMLPSVDNIIIDHSLPKIRRVRRVK